MAGVHSHDRNIILKYCVEHDITALVIPRIGDVLMAGAHRMHLFHLPIMRVGRYSPSFVYVIIKRVMDIVFALVGLVVFSPVMLVTAIAIARDGGPVLFHQTRLTKNGKEFELYKFRSMYVGVGDEENMYGTTEEDPRVTPVGKVIRRFRIDEIPQLFNVLKGDMSIVGPRPEWKKLAEKYAEELPEFTLRLQAKAGLTGYAQVYGKYDTTPYDKLQMDLMYISTAGIPQDISIIFATFKVLFQRESTEGFKRTTPADGAAMSEWMGVPEDEEFRETEQHHE